MARGEATQTKVHYKGKSDDFLVFIDDTDTYTKWLADKSIPLAHFVSSFKVFLTHNHGSQGTFDTAPKTTLASEFDTEDVDEAIKVILQNGTTQTTSFPERVGTKNDSMGSQAGH
ncbi:hypothetical protein G7046_g4478 [Stylonectria norvegica]|nr:hypothetical protein G7046_g4478 [Stylonectria norvegica]